MDSRPPRRFELLLTAKEAFPALENAFLNAERDIIAGFRIFDPWTKLRSDKAKHIGDTWFDLVVHTLNRGVHVSLIISDFDPVVRAGNHTDTWSSIRALIAAAEASRMPHLLKVSAAMHPARVGILPRLLLWPRLVKEIRESLVDVNQKSKSDKEHYLRNAPQLRPMVKWQSDKIVPRLCPPPTLVPVTHHQKIAVFDSQQLYIGGLDLNDRRYDTPEHEQIASETWHDAQVIVDGPVAQEAADHLRAFQDVCNGDPPSKTVHLLRTMSAKRKMSLPFLSPKTVVGELAAIHQVQVAKSETLIYLESQYFRDRNLAKQLAKRARANPALSLILILPAAPEDAAFDTHPGSDVAYGEYLQVKCVEMVKKAFGPRIFIGSPAQLRSAKSDGRATVHGAPIIYVHAKVSIFDNRCGVVSSANLNGRSFAWDTEAGIATQDAHETALLKLRCFAHWLGDAASPACFDDATACASWAAHAAQNATLPPEQRKGFIVPYSTAKAASLGYNLPGVPDEMV